MRRPCAARRVVWTGAREGMLGCEHCARTYTAIEGGEGEAWTLGLPGLNWYEPSIVRAASGRPLVVSGTTLHRGVLPLVACARLRRCSVGQRKSRAENGEQSSSARGMEAVGGGGGRPTEVPSAFGLSCAQRCSARILNKPNACYAPDAHAACRLIVVFLPLSLHVPFFNQMI